MCEGYEEDLDMYEEAQGPPMRQLDSETLLGPSSTLSYLKSPPLAEPDTPVVDALDAMIQSGAGAVLVVDHGKVVGIFSGRDALMKRVYHGKDLCRLVRDVMTPDPECLTPDDSIALALNRMVQAGYRHVPLVGPNGAPVGLLRLRDVIGHLTSFFPREVINAPPHSECNPPDRMAVGG